MTFGVSLVNAVADPFIAPRWHNQHSTQLVAALLTTFIATLEITSAKRPPP